MSIASVLKERGGNYGHFKDNAETVQALKQIMELSGRWSMLPPVHREALHMIVHKIGRILHGDPMYKDSFVDIIGYTQLVINYIDQLEKEDDAPFN
jgi:hypothetical protein